MDISEVITANENVLKCCSNSNLAEVKEFVSAYTIDSAPSSTFVSPHSNNITTICKSLSNAPKSFENYQSAPASPFQLRKPKANTLYNDKSETDFPYSQSSDTSINEDIVNATNASLLDVTCVLHITPPQANNYPDIVRLHTTGRYYTKFKDNLDSDRVVTNILSNYDQEQLFYSPPQTQITKEDVLNHLPQSNRCINSIKEYSSMAVQTTPVRILPLHKKDGKKDHKLVKEQIIEIDSTSNKEWPLKSSDSKLKDQTSHQETQPPHSLSLRTITNSELTTCTKNKENTDFIDDNHKCDVFWGDAFYDYKQSHDDVTDNAQALNCYSIKPKIKISIGDCKKTDDQIGKTTYKMATHRPVVASVSTSSSPKIGNRKYNIVSRTIRRKENKKETDFNHFQKCFELQPHDDIVKSYLTPIDRRIRSMCSKVGCKIRMFGPIDRSQSELSRQPQSIIRVKTFYYIIVSADTNERLDKSIKCIQDTFPKTFLKEKYNNRVSLDNCGDEIPL